ncbi:MAG: hypothetical protein ACXAEU_16735 [Candidatus Hodarchaeales archaeon]
MTYDFKPLKKRLSKFLGYYSRTEPKLVSHEKLLEAVQFEKSTNIDWILAQGIGGCSFTRNGKRFILISKKHAINEITAFFIAGHEIVEEYLRDTPGSGYTPEKVAFSPSNTFLTRKLPDETISVVKKRIVKFLLDDKYNLNLLLEEMSSEAEKEVLYFESASFNQRSLKEGFCTVLGGVLANFQSEKSRKIALREELIGAVERAENRMKNWQSLEKYRQELSSRDFKTLQDMAIFTTLIYDSGILKCINSLRARTISAWDDFRIMEWTREIVQKLTGPEAGLLLMDSRNKERKPFIRQLKELENIREIYSETRSKAFFLGIKIDKSLIQTQDTLSPIRVDLENLLE